MSKLRFGYLGTHTAEQWEDRLALFEGRCSRCRVNDTTLYKKLIKPVFMGGSLSANNLQPLCGFCWDVLTVRERSMARPKVVACSMHAAPLHSGHRALLKEAKSLGDLLIVIINNDHQLRLKHGHVFMDQDERTGLVADLFYVDGVAVSIDTDRSVSETLELIRPDVLAHGGDVSLEKLRESEVCERLGIQIELGVGGYDKKSSSSELLKKWASSASPPVYKVLV